jgi:hypothetical protein
MPRELKLARDDYEWLTVWQIGIVEHLFASASAATAFEFVRSD